MSKKKEGKIDDAQVRKLLTTRQLLLANELTGGSVGVSGNIHWEELTCVGYFPEKRRLQATVRIKQATGYSGNLCTPGSLEHIRFFIDWGSGFQDLGYVSFRAHDISDAPAGQQHPLNYMVYMDLDESQHKKLCFAPVLPKVRAVLSWNTIPSTNPNQAPYFGNSKDCNIQINARQWIFTDLFEHLKIKPELVKATLPKLDLSEVIPEKLAGTLTINEKYIKEYKELDVPDARGLYPVLHKLQAPSKSAFPKIEIEQHVFSKLKIDLSKLVQVINDDKANVTYEELYCVGLNTATDKLGAVIRVKKSAGYGSGLCSQGSFEHVAFWADWNNNGTWDEYLGTVSVNVHNFQQLPDGGLCYAVELPVDVTKRLKSCSNPNIVKIRAVLSWSSLPSTTDPDDLNTWGNRVDALVQIRPGQATDGPSHRIDFIGNIMTDDIDPVTHLARPSVIHGLQNNRPWGGSVNFRGEILNSGLPGTVHYQVQFYDTASSSWLPVNASQSYVTSEPGGGGSTIYNNVTTNAADYGGWFPYLPNPATGKVVLNDILAVWDTGTRQGAHQVRLAYTTDPAHNWWTIKYSQVYTIMLDNDQFTVNPGYGAAVNFGFDIDLVIDGGDCHQYGQNQVLNGHLRVKDQYFGRWALSLEPSAHYTGDPINPGNPDTRDVISFSDNGDDNAPWTLNTSTLQPCGYTVRLVGYKRTIFNSSVGSFHWRDKYVGFSVV